LFRDQVARRDVAIKKNDAVILDAEELAKSSMHLRFWFPDDRDWKVISSLPNSVGIVLGVRTREREMPTAAKSVTKITVVQTAEVAWPEGVVGQCPVQFLHRV
jgi:hypothetical protein